MSELNQRNFGNFELGDNVYELADGLVPEIAELLEVSLSVNGPNSEDLQSIVSVLGRNKVLRDNAEVEAIGRDMMVDLVERSGIQTELSRSLWTPDKAASYGNVDAVLVMGGMANWQDRTVGSIPKQLVGKPVYSIAGERVMDSGTEKPNPNVKDFESTFGKYPKEYEYASSVVIPALVAARHRVLLSSFESTDGDEMLGQSFVENPHLLEGSVAFARVANAGILAAIQMRDAARLHNPSFDSDPSSPQVYVVTDTIDLARTEEQEGDPRHYQKAATALRNVVLTAKKLHETDTTVTK